jgi:dienelactone hydrolase
MRTVDLIVAAILALGLSTTEVNAEIRESAESVTIDGASERMLLVRNDTQPVARVLVMFPGGDGRLGLSTTPSAPSAGQGYTASARRELVRPGIAVLLVDSPARQPSMSVEFRESAAYRRWLNELFAELRARFPGVQLYAVGYSNGAVSALVAGREEGVAGVILIGGVFRSLADVESFRVDRPILVIHHEADRCVPPEFDAAFRFALKPTMVRAIALSYDASPCGPNSAHQFRGQEATVADVVHEWLSTGRAPSRVR